MLSKIRKVIQIINKNYKEVLTKNCILNNLSTNDFN